MWCITFIDLWIWYPPFILGINPSWWWCMILLMYFWIQFANILLSMFASMFIWNIGLKFSVLLVPISSCRIRKILASENKLESLPSSSNFGNSLRCIGVCSFWMFGKILLWSHLVHDIYLLGVFLITTSISLTIIHLFRFSDSSWFSFGRVCF